MRFFTMQWWSGDLPEEAADPDVEYTARLAAIRDRLPADLLATQETISLHDARLRELRLSVAEKLLVVCLDNHRGDERFTLTYRGVEGIESTADPEIGLRGPAGYGDLGYSEVEILAGGTIEHRLLFSTGIEIVIVFHEFQLQRDKLA